MTKKVHDLVGNTESIILSKNVQDFKQEIAPTPKVENAQESHGRSVSLEMSYMVLVLVLVSVGTF